MTSDAAQIASSRDARGGAHPARSVTAGPGPGGSTLADCTAAGYDLSEGMVYTGWAMVQPDASDRYGAIEKQARAAKRGLWRGR